MLMEGHPTASAGSHEKTRSENVKVFTARRVPVYLFKPEPGKQKTCAAAILPPELEEIREVIVWEGRRETDLTTLLTRILPDHSEESSSNFS